MQKLKALIRHEICPGLSEDLLIFGQIDGNGTVIWDDQYGILKDKCEFIRISVIEETGNLDFSISNLIVKPITK